MPRKQLEGEVLAGYIGHVKAEISREAERLGFDVGKLINRGILDSRNERWDNRPLIQFRSGAWGIDATISVELKLDANSNLGFIAECGINWCSTGRSVSQAVHAIAVYQRVVEMAAIIEGVVR
jgi:hypothetical protein